MANYGKFSSICHLTSCKKAIRVIEDNGIDQEIRTFDSPLVKESVTSDSSDVDVLRVN